ncbi:MAG: phosphate acyltransferase PlsX [bacterium]
MKIAIDVMGGDYAPSSVLNGILQLDSSFKDKVILVGDEVKIKDILGNKSTSFEIIDTKEFIDMHESPTISLRNKKQSSIIICNQLVKNGKADAVISAGNTGTCMASSYLELGVLPGIHRPVLASILPTNKNNVILLDVGANVDTKSRHLFQFAIMGYVYAKYVLGKKEPKIGLLNIGEEPNKGNNLSILTYNLLKNSQLPFIGNIEGRDILKGKVDIIVCDGFIGNIILKFTEGVVEVLSSLFKETISKGFLSKLGFLLLSKNLRNLKKKLDYSEYGGVPLLGVNGVSIISHGSSSPKAIKNAIMVAEKFVNYKINQHITEEIKKYE